MSFQKFNFYLNRDRDGEAIAWLDTQKNISATVREALLFYLAHQPGNETPASTTPINSAAVYQAIDQALTERFDLSAIRQVVEAGVSNALSGLSLSAARTSPVDEEEDWLDEFDNTLLID